MKTLLQTLFFLLLATMLSVLSRAQNSLTHNTGSLEVTMIDNGYIGDNYSGTYGGIIFNGNQNAMAMSGLIFGQNGEAYGSFGSIFEDFYNEIPIAGFYPHPYFNQYAYYTIALSSNPDSKTFVETFSNTGQDFVYLKANFSNNVMNVDDLYPGIFADWDIGDYSANRGGYNPSMNLFYMYENGGSIDTNYYGIMGISVNGLPLVPNTVKGMITDSVAWNRWQVYHYMTSTVFDTIRADADYRMYACLGPHSFQAGSTLSVVIAIVAGTSLEDLLANAQAAIDYGPFTPVENTSITVLDFSLHQNYPNPFNPSTTFRYSIPTQSKVVIKVYGILGNEIATLMDEEKSVGTYELTWNTANLPSRQGSALTSGVYFYQLKAGEFVSTKKMILLK